MMAFLLSVTRVSGILSLLAVLSFAGCVSPTRQTGAGVVHQPDTVRLTVHMLGRDRTILPDTARGEEMVLVMPVVAGGVFGEVGRIPLLSREVQPGETFDLDLASLKGPMAKSAAPWGDTEANRPLVVSPIETRLARLGTFTAEGKNPTKVWQTMFVDSRNSDRLLLVYVDRPCSIRGENSHGGETFDHVIDFPSSGLHWVRSREIAPGRNKLSYEPGVQDAILGIRRVTP